MLSRAIRASIDLELVYLTFGLIAEEAKVFIVTSTFS